MATPPQLRNLHEDQSIRQCRVAEPLRLGNPLVNLRQVSLENFVQEVVIRQPEPPIHQIWQPHHNYEILYPRLHIVCGFKWSHIALGLTHSSMKTRVYDSAELLSHCVLETNLNRLFIRYGNPTTITKSSTPDYTSYAKTFISTFPYAASSGPT
jgi:hypothetical protein